jgi:predicted nucleic acid-binding protein
LLALLVPRTGFHLVLTELVARKDLNPLSVEITSLEAGGKVSVKALLTSDPHFRRLRKQGVHPGEAEAIAWALSQPKAQRPVFISNDRGARRWAEQERVPTGDLLDLLIEHVDRELLSKEEMRTALAPWDDRRQQQCKPKDWSGFERTFAVRGQAGRHWSWEIRTKA